MNFKSSNQAKDSLGEHTLHGTIQVYTLRSLPQNVSLSLCLKQIERRVPSVFFRNIDSIYIGHFREFEENNTNAFYSDGALFISNNQSDNEDLIDDILHETAHAVEREFEGFIYDTDLQKEFISKRKTLFRRLSTIKDLDAVLKQEDFMRLEYDQDFDELLYQTIGYPQLHSITYDLFASTYGATSLQEYWANGFENYFVGNPIEIKKVSPVLYNKISTLSEEY